MAYVTNLLYLRHSTHFVGGGVRVFFSLLKVAACFSIFFEVILAIYCVHVANVDCVSPHGPFGFRSCLFYSSLVLPVMIHLLCNPVVMSCVSSDLEYGSPGSNSRRKIILACCYKLSGGPDGWDLPPQVNKVA